MSLEKQIIIGEMTVGQLCDISVRTDTIITDAGDEVSRSFHRHVVSPGSDISEEDEKVQATANALWTPEVISVWEAAQPKPEPEPIEPVEVVTEPTEGGE